MDDSNEMTFAQRMMQKMGWSEGKGLGKEETGMKDFIKPKMKFNTKGIGFTGVDNKWIAHQEQFGDLLTSLNKGEKPDQKKELACLTTESKLRGRTQFYAKMMRGKDLSNRSSQDLSAIIVPLAKKEQPDKPETALLPSEESNDILKSSQVPMTDYFAQMMAKRKSKSAVEPSIAEDEKKSKKKRKRPPVVDESPTGKEEQTADNQMAIVPDASEGQDKKKKKKSKRKVEETLAPEEPPVEEVPEKKRKKEKKSKVPENVTEELPEIPKEKRKKSKKDPTPDPQEVVETTPESEPNLVDQALLLEIRGKKLKPSKAEPIRDIQDEDQLAEVHELWQSGNYVEFMKGVYSGKFPRWMAIDKNQFDRMVEGRTKFIDLADIRSVLKSKWKGDNAHEIWGYTNLPLLVLDQK